MTRCAPELALRESEVRFRSLVQNSSDMVTIVGSDWQVTYRSPSAWRFLGVGSEHRPRPPDGRRTVRGGPSGGRRDVRAAAPHSGRERDDPVPVRAWRRTAPMGRDGRDEPSGRSRRPGHRHERTRRHRTCRGRAHDARVRGTAARPRREHLGRDLGHRRRRCPAVHEPDQRARVRLQARRVAGRAERLRHRASRRPRSRPRAVARLAVDARSVPPDRDTTPEGGRLVDVQRDRRQQPARRSLGQRDRRHVS